VTTSREQAIRKAFRQFRPGRAGLQVDEEHGQEWITELTTGGQWAVEDAEGPGTFGGFVFEEVTAPDED
jgi:myo-inositol catabolism protein IolC